MVLLDELGLIMTLKQAAEGERSLREEAVFLTYLIFYLDFG